MCMFTITFSTTCKTTFFINIVFVVIVVTVVKILTLTILMMTLLHVLPRRTNLTLCSWNRRRRRVRRRFCNPRQHSRYWSSWEKIECCCIESYYQQTLLRWIWGAYQYEFGQECFYVNDRFWRLCQHHRVHNRCQEC